MHKALKSLTVLVVFATSIPAWAEEVSLDDKIKYILEVNEVEQSADFIIYTMNPYVDGMLRSMEKRNISRRITPDVIYRATAIVSHELKMHKPEFMKHAAFIYKSNLSEEEITALYEFYKSPIGSRIGRKMANLLPEMDAHVTVHMTKLFESWLAKDEILRRRLALPEP